MNLRKTFDRSLRLWPLIVFLMLAGGLLGLAISAVRTPVYEASAAIVTSIDYTRTGALTDVQEDNAVGVVGDVIRSPGVIDQVLLTAAAQGFQLDSTEFSQISTAERQNTDWYLRVRSADPQKAARLANIWAEQALVALTEAKQQALIGAGLLTYQDSLESCLTRMTVSEPQQADCSPDDLAVIQAGLAESAALASQATQASLGLNPATGFLIGLRAEVPVQPVRDSRGSLVLGGAVVGLLISLLLIASPWAGAVLFWQKKDRLLD